MPSYDYRCGECKAEFTVDRSMSDSSAQSCTQCGSAKANRIYGVFIVSGGSTPDYGQGTERTSGGAKKKSGCSSCSSKSCGTC